MAAEEAHEGQGAARTGQGAGVDEPQVHGAGAEAAVQPAGGGLLSAATLPAAAVRVAVGILVLGGMTAGTFFLVTDVIGPSLGPGGSGRGPTPEAEVLVAEQPALPGEQFVVEEIVVNPAGTRGKRFLRLGVALETAQGPAVTEELSTRKAQVRDLFIREFSSRGLDELTDPTVREEIRLACIDKINGFLVSGDISNLYFTDYVLQ
jgi:flagellar basal body-associated protein FliL